MRIPPLIWSDVEYEEKLIGAAKAGLNSGVVFFRVVLIVGFYCTVIPLS